MRKHHGQKYVVLYLKACQLALQKKVAADRIDSLRDINSDLPLPRLSTSRLPRFIPLADRRAISRGSASTIRWWNTLFSVYRVILIPGDFKLNTITDKYSGDPDALVSMAEELGVKAKSLLRGPSADGDPGDLLLLETASPSSKVS